MFPAVTERENLYRVTLVRLRTFELHGHFVYRGKELPVENQIIAIEPSGDMSSGRARVTRVSPEAEFPIEATELEPK